MNLLKLRIKWSKKEDDFVVYFPRKADGGWILHYIIGKRKETSFKDSVSNDKNWTRVCGLDWNPYISLFEVDFIGELVERGFDKTTLKFEVSIDLRRLKTDFSHLLDNLSPRDKKTLKAIAKKNNLKLSDIC